MLKTKIIRQKLMLNFDKNKNLVLQSIKLFANSKNRIDRCIVAKKDIAKLLNAKTNDNFRHILTKDLKVIANLNLDSKAVKNQLCTHTRYISTSNRIAKFLKRDKLQTIYDLAKPKKAVKKVTAKKVTAKKVNKK